MRSRDSILPPPARQVSSASARDITPPETRSAASGPTARRNDRRAKRIACALLLLALLPMIFPIPASAREALRIAYPVFQPFHWVNDQGQMQGLFYDIITEALEKRMGIAVIWTAYPWIRCQENLKTGVDDIILTVPTAERSVYTITHQHPFYEKPLNLFTYKGHARMDAIRRIGGIGDLASSGLKVITYSGNGWNSKHIRSQGIRTYETPYLESVWRMLAQKRGDLVIEWPPSAWPMISRLNLDQQIIDTGFTITAMPFHLLLRKGAADPTMLQAFDATVQRMKADGTISAILRRYQ
jgi:polar amino acid transport system substrate-binding protein